MPHVHITPPLLDVLRYNWAGRKTFSCLLTNSRAFYFCVLDGQGQGHEFDSFTFPYGQGHAVIVLLKDCESCTWSTIFPLIGRQSSADSLNYVSINFKMRDTKGKHVLVHWHMFWRILLTRKK